MFRPWWSRTMAVWPEGRRLFRPCSYAARAYYSTDSKFNIEVGGTFQINLPDVDAEVDVSNGESFEEIVLKGFWKPNLLVRSEEAFNVITKSNLVSFNMESDELKEKLLRLSAIMPGRWCNLILNAGKRLVQVESLKDANISVKTTGGNIKLGKVWGNKAVIESTGGSFMGELVSAVLELKTKGGNVSLKKAVGTRLWLDSDGGDVVVGFVYGDDVQLISNGGQVQISHLQAQKMARISSKGGHVKIGGLDGNIEICTGGGNLELQLLANANEVKVDAGSGDVMLYVTSESDVQVENLKGGADPEVKRQPKSESRGCRVLISSSGQVATKTRSWLESIMPSEMNTSGLNTS